MLRNLFFTFVSVAAGFLTFVPTQVIAVDDVFVSLSDINDNPDAYMGKTLTTKVFFTANDIDPIKVFSTPGNRLIFDGALLMVLDGSRKGSERFGSLILDENQLNIVMMHKKMARDLKDALAENKAGYNCTATVTIGKQETKYGALGPVMVIHAIETQTTGGTVKIAESMYPK